MESLEEEVGRVWKSTYRHIGVVGESTGGMGQDKVRDVSESNWKYA